MAQVLPTGAHHEVGINDMFFSTTDERGVIQESNSVFVRLSRYSLEQLTGAAHNIIRHPDMPGGAFRAMWDTLHAGKPFVAYVHNLAQDGSQYDVLATVTPLKGGGYLSVRTKACCVDTFAAASDIYDTVRDQEDAYLAAGDNRRQAAEKGAGSIVKKLQEAGFASYNSFQWAVLPAEVKAREALGGGLPPLHETSGALGAIDRAVHGIYADLNQWMDQLDELGRLSDQLKTTSARVDDELATTAHVMEKIDQSNRRAGSRYSGLLMPLQLWAQMREIIEVKVSKLVKDIGVLDELGAETRFDVALARLQTSMVAHFVAELCDGKAGERSAASIRMLAQTLRDEVDVMQDRVVEHGRRADEVEKTIKSVISLMEVPLQLIADWRKTVQGQTPAELAELLGLITASIDGAVASISTLNELVANIDQLSRGFDITSIAAQIDQVEQESSAEKFSH